MKRLVIGILAHVDAGKTTLSEGFLYLSGALRKLGRVDHGTTFLDTETLERERGITIVAKQAQIQVGETEFILLDTPGHADFSAEMERTLQVLDCAILVISGTDGVQSHTRTLWTLLRRYRVPTFLFVNKMDLPGANKEHIQEQLNRELESGCIDFSQPREVRDEEIAMGSEDALELFLESGEVSVQQIQNMVAERTIFPCWFGSALKLTGVEDCLHGMAVYATARPTGQEFGARVFKISRDGQGTRLTWMKLTGGILRAKTVLSAGTGEELWSEKVDQIRIYSGTKFKSVEQAEAGMIVAVTGLTHTTSGMGFGTEVEREAPVLEPVLSYRLVLPEGTDPHTALPKLRQLEEEDPMLRIVWKEHARELHVQLMGQIQLEILQRQIAERFDIPVQFDRGSIVYKETISNTVEGVGHFEPLRHYAEVHLLMEPAPRGSGIQVASVCSVDQLDLNWQRLILTHVMEREHPGVLTGSGLTDVKITLVAGRAHQKHTEGGDFRQATYRAIRQGLMQATSVLLEPFYDFRLEVPLESVGRAMNDLQGMGGNVEPPEQVGALSVLRGYAPVEGLRDYWQQVTAYTHGLGHLSCTVRGYEPCVRQDTVISESGYEAERDVENPADSIFCSHGSGTTVKWNEVWKYMHVGVQLECPERGMQPNQTMGGGRVLRGGSLEQDKELMEIFERTYGKVERKFFEPTRKPARTALSDHYTIQEQDNRTEYVLVDGYNILFAWDELAALAREDMEAARVALMDILANYRGFRHCELILVFDAYKVKGNPGSIERYNQIYVVYTKEAETADAYIERTTYDLGRHHRVRVATSDGLEQMIILGHGALRVSARVFKAEVEQAQGQITHMIEKQNQKGKQWNSLQFTASMKYDPRK